MDDEILNTVHSIFGKSVEIVDCEKTSSVRQEEVLLINGVPVTLDGNDGDAIKKALLTGQVPSVELLNQLLFQAGVLRQPIQLETSLSVKSSMVTTEEVSVARGGRILDGRTCETKEDYVYSSSKKELWEPVKESSEKMSQPPRFRLAEKATSSTQEAVDGCKSSCSSTGPVKLSQSDQIIVGEGSSNESFYNYNDSLHRTEDGDDDDDYKDNDEDGELYLLNSPQTNSDKKNATRSFAKRLVPVKSITTTLLSSTNDESNDVAKLNQKGHSISTLASISEKKSSFLSFDSGHDGIFNSPSQQTTTSNQTLPQLPQSTTNTDHSISSCYDFISSDEADFLVATQSSNNDIFSKDRKTMYQSNDKIFPDLQHRETSLSHSSYGNNVINPDLGKKLSMSSSNCVPVKPTSSQPKLQQKSNSETQHVTGNKATTASTTISTTSVENGLVFRDGNLISGPLDALIAHMVPSSTYYPDRSFIFSFLLSARLFIRPHELLAKISDTWENQQLFNSSMTPSIDVVDEKTAQPQSSCSDWSQQMNIRFTDEQSHQKAMKSAQNCIQLLSEWIDTFPYDFRDERLMQHVRVLARKCVYIDNGLGKIVSNILQNLVQRLTVLEKYEEFLQTLTANEGNEPTSTAGGLGISQKAHCLGHSGLGHTNSGFVYPNSTVSCERNDTYALTDTSNASGSSTSSQTVGMTHKSLSSSYTTSGTCHQHQPVHYHHHYSHQSDSSSNSANTLSPAGLNIGGCTSSGALNNGAEITGICDHCPNAALLAHQLTHIELERLSHIGPEEFVQAFAKENHLESFSDMKKTRNLESYVQWFNRLSYFTATEIVKYPKKKQRVRIIEFWVETARECFNIGNFNSLMAIIAGLNLSPIARLKKTWSKIQSAKFSVLEHQMDPTSNFNSYRSTLKAAMWRSEGATNERERIIIPFFSLLVKDLYFLNEGCSNRLPNGHINFEKFWQLAKQVMEFNTWKKVTCPFEKIPKVIMFLQMSSVLNENTLSMASFECEPPENNQEKGRYKTLKSETKNQQQHQQT